MLTLYTGMQFKGCNQNYIKMFPFRFPLSPTDFVKLPLLINRLLAIKQSKVFLAGLNSFALSR